MSMFNLIECSKNFKETARSLWNYYRDESNNPANDNYNADSIANSESFTYKSSIIGKTLNNARNNDRNNNKKKNQRCSNCCAIKIFKHLLENIRHTID